MMPTIFLVIIAAVFVAYVLPQFISWVSLFDAWTSPWTPPVVPHTTIRLFDGPNNGQVHDVESDPDNLPHFFVAPYLPRDENGNPQPPEQNIIHQSNGMVYVKPSLAYYQQVTPEEYFYVRDITDDEWKQIHHTGQLPEFKPQH